MRGVQERVRVLEKLFGQWLEFKRLGYSMRKHPVQRRATPVARGGGRIRFACAPQTPDGRYHLDKSRETMHKNTFNGTCVAALIARVSFADTSPGEARSKNSCCLPRCPEYRLKQLALSEKYKHKKPHLVQSIYV